MKQLIGKYITHSIPGESFKAYLPPELPPKPPIDLSEIYPHLERATHALAQLNTVANSIPNTSLFIYMYVRKEALLSSQIEGTQSSFSDLMLFEHHQKTAVSLEDVEEVSNYVKALQHGLKRLRKDLPLSLRLLREMHKILLSGTRGSGKLPGEFRHSQNWIGGTRPSNALFVPPPADHMMNCLSNLEIFFHDTTLPVLIKTAIAHIQFETIHPFLDGNGRIGRLLITLQLCESGLLFQPILYLSLFFKKHRALYYELLQETRLYGSWKQWIEFFLEGVTRSAHQAIEAAHKINQLFEKDCSTINSLGRIRFSCIQVLEYLKKLPQVSVPLLAKELKMTPPTARAALQALVKQGVVKEISGKKRDQIYLYPDYLKLLEYGAEPI
ncbi:MAG: Fic family protein [Chthoniobacterales bacterium]